MLPRVLHMLSSANVARKPSYSRCLKRTRNVRCLSEAHSVGRNARSKCWREAHCALHAGRILPMGLTHSRGRLKVRMPLDVQADVEAWGWRLCAAADSQSLDVLAVPVIFGHVLPVSALSSFLDTIGCASCGARRRRTPDVVQTLLQSVACRSAVMFGQRLTRCEGAGIVCALARARLPMHCAHGRPTAAHVVDLAPLLATLQALRHRRPGLGERGVCKQRCGVASRLAATLMAMRQS